MVYNNKCIGKIDLLECSSAMFIYSEASKKNADERERKGAGERKVFGRDGDRDCL